MLRSRLELSRYNAKAQTLQLTRAARLSPSAFKPEWRGIREQVSAKSCGGECGERLRMKCEKQGIPEWEFRFTT